MIEHTSCLSTWEGWTRDVDDVFYRASHLKLWATEWGLEFLGVRYLEPGGQVLLPLLRDPLDRLPGGEGRCDLRTAYDFGGPRLIGSDSTFSRFETAFDGLLADLGCVTLFQRIHPFHTSVPRGAAHHADNQVIDLSAGLEALVAGWHSSWRRNWRKAARNGCTTSVEADPELFSRFYEMTMDKVDAAPWYRFSPALFSGLIGLDEVDQLVTRGPDGVPVATLLSLRSGSDRFYHLGASDPQHLHLRGNFHLFATLIEQALEAGASRLHLGGGAPDLITFKSRIATGTVPYRVEKRVVDPDTYRQLCAGSTSNAFPAYLT